MASYGLNYTYANTLINQMFNKTETVEMNPNKRAIKIINKSHAEQIQMKLFRMGYKWADSGNKIIEMPSRVGYICFYEDTKLITYSGGLLSSHAIVVTLDDLFINNKTEDKMSMEQMKQLFELDLKFNKDAKEWWQCIPMGKKDWIHHYTNMNPSFNGDIETRRRLDAPRLRDMLKEVKFHPVNDVQGLRIFNLLVELGCKPWSDERLVKAEAKNGDILYVGDDNVITGGEPDRKNSYILLTYSDLKLIANKTKDCKVTNGLKNLKFKTLSTEHGLAILNRLVEMGYTKPKYVQDYLKRYPQSSLFAYNYGKITHSSSSVTEFHRHENTTCTLDELYEMPVVKETTYIIAGRDTNNGMREVDYELTVTKDLVSHKEIGDIPISSIQFFLVESQGVKKMDTNKDVRISICDADIKVGCSVFTRKAIKDLYEFALKQ